MAPGTATAAIDLGSSAVTTVVGEISQHGHMQILGVGQAPAAGIERGQINHVANATRAIQASVEQAERSSGRQILSASIAVAGAHLESVNNRGVVAIPDLAHPIDDDDLRRVIDAGRAITLDSSRTILHALPRFFVVDSQNRVLDPRGMHGQRLDVEVHIVTAGRGAVQNAVQCVSGAGVGVELCAAQPIVAAQLALRMEEMEQGAVLVDLGAGTTDIAAYAGGAIAWTESLPIGGALVTRDLMVGLRAPVEVAEEAKLLYANAVPDFVVDEAVELAGFADQRTREVPRRLIAEIAQARVSEIIAMVLKSTKRARLNDALNGGFVLSGGGALMPGTVELFEAATGLPVRVATAADIYGLTDQLSDPAAVVALGLLQWTLGASEPQQQTPQRRARSARPALGGIASAAKGVLGLGKVFLPG